MPPPNGTLAQSIAYNAGNIYNDDAAPKVEQSLWDAFVATDKSPNGVSQADLMADPSLMTPAMFAAQQNQGGGSYFSSGGSGGIGGGNNNGIGGNGGTGGNTGDPVSNLAEARAPRGLTFDNLFGSTRFDPETGEFITEDSSEYAQFQQGLLEQLQGSQAAYQSFNPQDAASEYLRGVNAIREPLRAGQTQSSLSRLIQSGKLGATAGTQALAQLESAQENQRFQEGVQATQYGQDIQDAMLQRQKGLFGLSSAVAGQQFAGQQQALGAVPLLQEIYSFAEEPAFQQQLAQMGIDAQGEANDAGLFGDIFKVAAPFIFG